MKFFKKKQMHKPQKEDKAPKALTGNEIKAVLSVLDRMAWLKVYNSLSAHVSGYKGTTIATQMSVKRYFELIAISKNVKVSFENAIKYMIDNGYIRIPELKIPKGAEAKAAPCYQFTRKSFDRYLESIRLTPKKKEALCTCLMAGLTKFPSAIALTRKDYVSVIEMGMKAQGYKIPEEINHLLFALLTEGLLLVSVFYSKSDLVHIKNASGISEGRHVIYPSEAFLRKYAQGTEWYAAIAKEDEKDEMEEAYTRGVIKGVQKMPPLQPVPLP